MQPLETLQEMYWFEILKRNYSALAKGNKSFPVSMPVAKCSFQEAMTVLSGNEAKLKYSITFPLLHLALFSSLATCCQKHFTVSAQLPE